MPYSSYEKVPCNVSQPKWAVVINDTISSYTKKHYCAITLLSIFQYYVLTDNGPLWMEHVIRNFLIHR